MALLVNSGPLSRTRVRGRPRAGDLVEVPGHGGTRDRGIDELAHALASVVVDEIEHTEAPPGGELIGDEVERPALVRPRGHGERHPRAGESLTPPSAHLQLHRPVEPVGALAVHDQTLGGEQSVQQRIAIARVLAG